MNTYATGRVADRNRQRKAATLAVALRRNGTTAAQCVDLDDKSRRAFERTAGVPRSSDLTWCAVARLLEHRPPRLATDRLPGCDCAVNEHGVLRDRYDWPCSHDGRSGA